MTPTRQIAANGKVYTVVDDFTSVYRVVVVGTVTDEVFGVPDGLNFAVRATRPDLDAKTTSKGSFAVIAYPEKSFPALAVMGYSIPLVLSAPGFQDQTLTVPIPAGAAFPVAAPAVALRHVPVRVQGRVVADTAARAPIAGATVISVDGASTPPGVHPLALRTPLNQAHAAGTTIRQIAMTSLGTSVVKSDALSGGQVVDLQSRAGLVVGSILRLANIAETAIEYAIVDSLGPGGAAAGLAFLREPLLRTALAGWNVQFLNPGAPGPSAVLAGGADAGNGLVLSSATLSVSPLEIDPGTPAVEYHELGALTDSDGYYSLDGVGQVKEVYLQASHVGFSSVTRGFALDYGQLVDVVDFRLP